MYKFKFFLKISFHMNHFIWMTCGNSWTSSENNECLIIRDLIVSVEVDILYISLVGYRNKQPNSVLDTLYVLTMNDE